MIMEGEAAILLETTQRAFGNQEKSKQRSSIVWILEEHTFPTVNFGFKGDWPVVEKSTLWSVMREESKNQNMCSRGLLMYSE